MNLIYFPSDRSPDIAIGLRCPETFPQVSRLPTVGIGSESLLYRHIGDSGTPADGELPAVGEGRDAAQMAASGGNQNRYATALQHAWGWLRRRFDTSKIAGIAKWAARLGVRGGRGSVFVGAAWKYPRWIDKL
ncbi:hypothetical protein [Nocardia cerradoensis]|uniref:hypothetical protein n=1 Tax=Nocardia cerradoensis TaxID=85688 RepID=UPI0012F69D7F|nr:hypothetical protein [Nocardia cerradoensis]NKY43277.1 hypothetical protein [Nocardia cerradoensis]